MQIPDHDEYGLITRTSQVPRTDENPDGGTGAAGLWKTDYSLDTELQLLELRQLELTQQQRGLKQR